MNIIEISSDSESDCLVAPPPSPKKSRQTHEARVREAREEVFADESLSPQQKRKLAAERGRDVRLAAQRKRHQEQKKIQRQRQEAARETSIEVAVGALSDAIPLKISSFATGESASKSPKSQLWPHNVEDDALIDSCHLPFPMADSLSSCVHAAAATSPRVCAEEQPEAPATPPSAAGPFPQVKISPAAVAQGDILPPAWSTMWASPRLPSLGVLDSSGDAAAVQQMSPRRSPTKMAIHQTRRRLQETRREMAAPAMMATTPLQAVMRHWERLWRDPTQLYRYWLGRPLFRRAEQADDQAMEED